MMSKTRFMSAKYFVGEHVLAGQAAKGVPHLEESGVPELMSDGIEERVKRQMKMPAEVHCIAQTPPPAAAKPVGGRSK